MTQSSASAGAGQVRRRHVIYIAGYDPLGFAHYHSLFKRELTRAQKIWPIKAAVTNAAPDPDGLASRWQIESSGPNWQVSTSYEYLRWDDLISRDMRVPFIVLFVRTVLVLMEYLFNGTIARLFRANPRFAIFYLFQPLGVIVMVVIPLLLGWVSARLLIGWFDTALWLAALTGAAIAMIAFRPICDYLNRWHVIQLSACWIWYRDWAHGRRPEFIVRLDKFAQRIIERTLAADADELLVIGHSGGGTIGIPIIARALTLDPEFARKATPVTFLALGTSLPVAALHPLSADVRAAIHRVATEPSLVWIDCQSRKDIINFFNFDMVGGVGIDAGPQRCNPLLWKIRFRDIVSPELYKRLRWNFHRMHFQFIMANDRRAPYDFFMFICGPARLLQWAKGLDATLAAFSADATYSPLPDSDETLRTP
jgi:hypothetical protein